MRTLNSSKRLLNNLLMIQIWIIIRLIVIIINTFSNDFCTFNYELILSMVGKLQRVVEMHAKSQL